jgi:hypothetical protein
MSAPNECTSMVTRIDIVDYFKNVHKMSGPNECTSMVTRIAMNLGCWEMANLTYIDGDVPILGLDHFVHMYILCEEPDQQGDPVTYPGPSTVLL